MDILYRFIFSVVVVGCTISPLHAGVITTLSLIEKDGVTTNNYPLTFGHVFKQGDVSSGLGVKYNGALLTTQFDKKTSWPDGSVKFGVVSVVIPKVAANETGTLTIETATSNNSSGAMDKSAILSTNVESKINLSNISGSGYSGSVSSSLRNQISSGELNYWLQGTVCTEILETQQLNNSLNTAWEARFYPGTSFGIRISNSVENVNILYRGNVGYDVSIQQGEASPTTVYTKRGYTHLHGSRWRKVFWLGAEPPETELRYNTSYLVSTGAVMPYDTSITVLESSIASEYAYWQAASKDIDGNGFITKYFPTTGGRREIGMLPQWSAMWLLSMDNRMKEIVLGNADMAGHIPRVHWRETDALKVNFGRVVTIDDRPTYDLIADTGGGIPRAIGEMSLGGWTPDRAHMGSFAYIPYLITGEYWYLQESLYWGAYSLSYDEYGRNGHGSSQDFSAGHDGSYGIIYDQVRGVAWSLRNISDAAAVALNGSLESTYFSSKLNNNIDWLLLGNTETSHGLHAVRTPREDLFTTSNWNLRIATWMHDFVVLSLSDIIRKGTANVSNVTTLRDRIGLFTIGRFTNHPAMNKWDGTGYVYPLAKENGGDYFANGSWEEYWQACMKMNNDLSLNQGYPHDSFAHYDYADSYLAISKSALAQLIHIKSGMDAYMLVNNNFSDKNFEENPTWNIIGGLVINSVK